MCQSKRLSGVPAASIRRTRAVTPSTSELLKWRIAPGIVILVVAGAVLWFYLRPPPPAPGVLQASGRVEGDLAAVGSKSGGRVVRMLPREGDSLETGALIAEMQSEQRQAELERAEHLLHTAREQVALARARAVSQRRGLEAAQLAVSQTEENSRVQIGEAEAGLGVARARLRQAEADMRRRTRDRLRYEKLFAEKVIAAETLDDTRSSEEVARAAVEAAREQVAQAKHALNRARVTRTTAAVRSKEAEAIAARLQEAITAVELARARMQTEEANLALARANLQDTRVEAPFEGTVLERLVETGEIVAPGIHMPDERTKLVFAVKLAIRDSEGMLKPGMPVDARIRWQAGSPWEDGMD